MANKKKDNNNLVVDAVLALPQMRNKKLIHLSIVGSRSKGLASSNSDYDVKAVVLHSKSDYLLQNITASKSFQTSIVDPQRGNAVDVEGTLVDYLTMQKYALTVNQAAYDALYGIVIYETPESKLLDQLFLKAYNPERLIQSFRGLLISAQKKAEKKNNDILIKEAANMVYYASMVHTLNSNDEPPPHDAFQLIEQLTFEPSLRTAMAELYRRRIGDKSRTDVDLGPFVEFIYQAKEFHKPHKDHVVCDQASCLQTEANEAFLKAICSRVADQ